MADSLGYRLDTQLGPVLHCLHHAEGLTGVFTRSPDPFPRRRAGSAMSLQVPYQVTWTEDRLARVVTCHFLEEVKAQQCSLMHAWHCGEDAGQA